MSKVLTLAVADKLATSAIQKCISKKFAPITVVVLDAAGHTVVSKRMDGCSPVGYTQFAHAKANTALITKGTNLTVILLSDALVLCESHPLPVLHLFPNQSPFTNTSLSPGTSRAFRDKYTLEGLPAKYCQMMAMVNITDGKMAPFPGGMTQTHSTVPYSTLISTLIVVLPLWSTSPTGKWHPFLEV